MKNNNTVVKSILCNKKCCFRGVKNLISATASNQVNMVFVSLFNAKLWKNLTLGNYKVEKHCCCVFCFMIGQWLRSPYKHPRTSHPVTFRANRHLCCQCLRLKVKV